MTSGAGTSTIELWGQVYPLTPHPKLRFNSLMISPLSGQIWARLMRNSEFQYITLMQYSQGEGPLLSVRMVSGSLLYPPEWFSELVTELPQNLLHRELHLALSFVQSLKTEYNKLSLGSEVVEMSPELISKIAALNSRILARDPNITPEEYKDALKALREERMSYRPKSESKAKAKPTEEEGSATLGGFLNNV